MLVLVAFVLVAWGATAVDVARRHDLRVRRRVIWFVLTLVMPVVVIPAYWLIRPLHPKKRAVASAPSARNARTHARALAEQTPGTPGAHEHADVWAADASAAGGGPKRRGGEQ